MIWARKGASRGESVERASWLGRVWDDDGGMSVVTWSADAGSLVEEGVRPGRSLPDARNLCADPFKCWSCFVVFLIFSNKKKAFRKAGAANSRSVDDEGRKAIDLRVYFDFLLALCLAWVRAEFFLLFILSPSSRRKVAQLGRASLRHPQPLAQNGSERRRRRRDQEQQTAERHATL